MKLYYFFPLFLFFQHAVEMHQNIGEVMIVSVSVGKENKKWVQCISCLSSNVATPFVSTV